MFLFGNSARFVRLNCALPDRSNSFESTAASIMTNKPIPAVHFPTAREKGPFPFPTAQSIAMAQGHPDAAAGAEEQLSAEELRLMADTMPGDGPGD
ncbi:MAG: hypothetical protein JWQ01_2151 [Massilia sp.]|nr:hypothetical protein [Massilia sp.]